MANLRLYKDFYYITSDSISGESYTLLDPYSMTATTNIDGSATFVENPITITKQDTGRYFATLNPNYYSFDHIYEICWHVYYVSFAPIKRLRTRFQVRLNNISNSIEIEVMTPKFDIVVGNKNIDIQL